MNINKNAVKQEGVASLQINVQKSNQQSPTC